MMATNGETIQNDRTSQVSPTHIAVHFVFVVLGTYKVHSTLHPFLLGFSATFNRRGWRPESKSDAHRTLTIITALRVGLVRDAVFAPVFAAAPPTTVVAIRHKAKRMVAITVAQFHYQSIVSRMSDLPNKVMITGAMAATVVPSTSPAAAAFGLRHSTTFALRDDMIFVTIDVVATDPPVLDTFRVYRVDPLPLLLSSSF